jgi:hypothetical protein
MGRRPAPLRSKGFCATSKRKNAFPLPPYPLNLPPQKIQVTVYRCNHEKEYHLTLRQRWRKKIIVHPENGNRRLKESLEHKITGR